jgi:hypothetical protein
MVNASDLHLGGAVFESLLGHKLSHLRSYSFSHSLQADARAVPQIMPQPLSSTSFPAYSSLIMHVVVWLVEALCYKPEGCGFESQ